MNKEFDTLVMMSFFITLMTDGVLCICSSAFQRYMLLLEFQLLSATIWSKGRWVALFVRLYDYFLL